MTKGTTSVNRAEAAKFLLLARYGDVDDVRNNGRFPDVLDGQWYTKYVVTAADKGIISGHPDGTFRPADTVNTAEFLKMLSLTFGLQLNLQHSYADVSPQDWFAPYAGIAQKYKLFPSQTRYLQPGDPRTREAVAVAIYQYLQYRHIQPETGQDKDLSLLLRKLKDPNYTDTYGDGGTWYIAAEGLGKIGKPAIPFLIEKLDTTDDFERTQALYALRLAAQNQNVKTFTGGEYVKGNGMAFPEPQDHPEIVNSWKEWFEKYKGNF